MSSGHFSYTHDGENIGAYGAFIRNGKLDTNLETSLENNSLCSRKRHNVHIPRQELRNMIIKKVEKKSILWSKRLISLSKQEYDNSGEDNIKLIFSDGTNYNVSCVIGCDGIYSAVRDLVYKDNMKKNSLNYLGYMVILGISPISSTINNFNLSDIQSHESNNGLPLENIYGQRQWVDGKTRVFSMPYDKNSSMWQLSFPIEESEAFEMIKVSPADNDTATVSKRLKKVALEKCDKWAVDLISLISSTEDSLVSGHPVYDRDPITPSFFISENETSKSISNSTETQYSLSYQEKVTLLGDAAHPMSPFKGQGANQALLDAVTLSQCLEFSELSHPARKKVNLALRQYEEIMCKRSEGKVLKSRLAAQFLHSSAAKTEANITRAAAAELSRKLGQNVLVV